MNTHTAAFLAATVRSTSLPLNLETLPEILTTFWFQTLIVVAIIAMLTTYLWGSSTNYCLAQNTFTLASRSDSLQSIAPKSKKLTQVTPNLFSIELEGNSKIKSAICTLSLKPRHDLIQTLVNLATFTETYDRLTIEATMQSRCENVIGITRNSTDFMKSRWDLETFTRPLKIESKLGTGHLFFADAKECIEKLLDSSTFVDWITAQPIEQIVFSDLPLEKPSKVQELDCDTKLEITYSISSKSDISIQEAGRMIDHFAIALSTANRSQASLLKCRRMRTEARVVLEKEVDGKRIADVRARLNDEKASKVQAMSEKKLGKMNEKIKERKMKKVQKNGLAAGKQSV